MLEITVVWHGAIVLPGSLSKGELLIDWPPQRRRPFGADPLDDEDLSPSSTHWPASSITVRPTLATAPA